MTSIVVNQIKLDLADVRYEFHCYLNDNKRRAYAGTCISCYIVTQICHDIGLCVSIAVSGVKGLGKQLQLKEQYKCLANAVHKYFNEIQLQRQSLMIS